MEKIVSLAKQRGFINQSSEIYGGIEAVWDYGPLGVLLKNNIKNLWWKRFVQDRDDIIGIEGSILMNAKVWEASGHLEDFTDPLIECKGCHSRFRADHIATEQCPNCGKKEFTEPRQFNLMLKTFLGPVEDKAHQTYLRPETAQSMFTNFKWVLETSRKKIPFGIAQIGKSFRNEITTGNFTFRSREFEIAEIEYFVKPGTDDKWFKEWVKEWQNFFTDLGIKKKNLRLHEHPKEKLAHYSKNTVDVEYKFPWGWDELAGIANRTDYDLRQHSKFSGKDLEYFDEEANKKYIPYVIEPTVGIERILLTVLIDAYEEVKGGRTETTKVTKEKEIVLQFDKNLAPIKVAVLPLVKNDSKLVKKAKEVYDLIKPHFMSQYDEVGSIGRRYRRQDEVGTPYCLTVDFDSLKQDDVTVRDRDTMKQERIKTEELVEYLDKKLNE